MKIGVLIVTYNRLDKLKRALRCYENQKYLPDFLLVYDNNSSDGTQEYLDSWKNEKSTINKKVITSSVNLGGSGGFHQGMMESIKYEFDWLWISDDDAYLSEDGFDILSKVARKCNPNVGAICGAVYEDGKLATAHRRVLTRRKSKFPFGENVNESEYYADSFKMDIFSFVGTAIRKDIILKCGYPEKDYFIWYDDSEYSYRVHKKCEIICIPKIVINHDVEQNASTGLTWKNYYGYRNKLNAMRSNKMGIYYCFAVFKLTIKNIGYFFTNRKKYYMIKTALHDHFNNITGISSYYKPGKKI